MATMSIKAVSRLEANERIEIADIAGIPARSSTEHPHRPCPVDWAMRRISATRSTGYFEDV